MKNFITTYPRFSMYGVVPLVAPLIIIIAWLLMNTWSFTIEMVQQYFFYVVGAVSTLALFGGKMAEHYVRNVLTDEYDYE